MESGLKRENALFEPTISEKYRKNIGTKIFIIAGMMVGRRVCLCVNALQMKHEN